MVPLYTERNALTVSLLTVGRTVQLFATFQIPKSNGPVIPEPVRYFTLLLRHDDVVPPPRRQEFLSVRGKSHAPDFTRMSFQTLQLIARLDIPQADRLVAATRRQASTVWGEGNRENAILVTLKLAY